MKRRAFTRATLIGALVLAAAVFGIGGAPRAHAQESCQPANIESGETTDEDALTARIIVSGTKHVTITGDVDATGCGIGVYVAPGAHATITHADIHSDALGTAFGIYNNGGQVTVDHSQVRGISGNGESCGDTEEDEEGGCTGGGGMGGGGDMGGGSGGARSYTGGRHGTAILFVGAGAQGTISASTISDYGRRGISVSGDGASVRIVSNTIVAPAVHPTWLNGIWIANGAWARIAGNQISGNVTPGPGGKSSSAIMIAGGPTHNGMPYYTTAIQISGNVLTGNDTGVLLSNPILAADGTTKIGPSDATRNYVIGNTITTSNPVANNDAGIKDAGGRYDHIVGNVISGYGATLAIVANPSQAIGTLQSGNTIR